MALSGNALWLETLDQVHHARSYRRLLSDLVDGRSGVTTATALKVSATGPASMNLDVAAGGAVVAGTEVSLQGAYYAFNDATVQVTINAAHASLPRLDLVVLRVRDAEFSGGIYAAELAVVTGTPAASPVVPAAPANSIVIAQIAVAALASAITNGNITDRRTQIDRPIGARVRSSIDLSPAAGSFIVLPMNTEDYDPFGFHSTVTNTDRLTVPSGYEGLYLVTAQITWGGATQTTPYLAIKKNGNNIVREMGNGLAFSSMHAQSFVNLAAGDYVSAAAYQNSGGTRDVVSRAAGAVEQDSPVLEMYRLSSAAV